MRILIRYFLILLIASSCASSNQLGHDIDAYNETMQLVEQLKRKPGKQKLWKRINQTYPHAVIWFESEINSANTGSAQNLRWTNICSQMTRVNTMTDSVKTIPGWENHISGLRSYTSELDTAKAKAMEECIQQAKILNKYNSRATLRIALFYLDQADEIEPGNTKTEILRKEINDKLDSLPEKE